MVESVAGQGYHYRQIRSLRNSLPRLLWAECSSLAAGCGSPPSSSGSWRTCRIAFLLIGLSADVIQSPAITTCKMVFVNVLRAEEKSPLIIYKLQRRLKTKHLPKKFLIFVQIDEHIFVPFEAKHHIVPPVRMDKSLFSLQDKHREGHLPWLPLAHFFAQFSKQDVVTCCFVCRIRPAQGGFITFIVIDRPHDVFH